MYKSNKKNMKELFENVMIKIEAQLRMTGASDVGATCQLVATRIEEGKFLSNSKEILVRFKNILYCKYWGFTVCDVLWGQGPKDEHGPQGHGTIGNPKDPKSRRICGQRASGRPAGGESGTGRLRNEETCIVFD
jgi:hypothetical protein